MSSYSSRSIFIATLILVTTMMNQALAGIFVPVGDLMFNRSAHSAILLPSGKVLVAGGTGTDHPTPSTSVYGVPRVQSELYDPSTGAWSETGQMATAAGYNDLVLLTNGKVLAVKTPCEIYDPTAGAWTATASPATSRDRPTVTLLTNGTVLITGGLARDGVWEGWATDSAELYDPATGKWTETGFMTERREEHTATLLSNGKVLVAGGRTSISDFSSQTAEMYDPATGQWSQVSSLNEGRYFHSATLLPNGKVLVLGGNDYNIPSLGLVGAEIYDPAMDAWIEITPPNLRTVLHTATLLPSGLVLVAGGGGGNAATDAEKDAELYDPILNAWQPSSPLRGERYANTATLLSNGSVLIVGGTKGGNATQNLTPIASAELYVDLPVPVLRFPSLSGAQLSFTNAPGFIFTVLSSTEISVPLSQWSAIGSTTEFESGLYQFTLQPSPDARRFYMIRFP
jgi:hypothetical protein